MSTYAMILIFCLGITAPLEFLSHNGVYRRPSLFLRAIWLPSSIYIVWDVIATRFNHWTFTAEHVSTFSIFGLPIEEIMFFVIIPLCAVLSYEAVCRLLGERAERLTPVWMYAFFAFGYIGTGVLVQRLWTESHDSNFPHRTFPWYFLATLCAVIIFTVWISRSKKTQEFLRSRSVFTTMAICLFFMVFVNGFLTKLSDPVVTYSTNLGPRIFFDIPIEDFFYGSVLLLWVLARYKKGVRT